MEILVEVIFREDLLVEVFLLELKRWLLVESLLLKFEGWWMTGFFLGVLLEEYTLLFCGGVDGGARAGFALGTSVGYPRWASIFSIASASKISQNCSSFPGQREHEMASTPYTSQSWRAQRLWPMRLM